MRLQHIIPNHVLSTNVHEMPNAVRTHEEALQGRTMLVRKAKVIPLEAIVRGYLTGPPLHSLRVVRLLMGVHRERMGGVQKVWHCARHHNPVGPTGVRETFTPVIYALDEGGAGRPRRKHLPRTRYG
jgi:hypothetical protein